MTIDGGDEVYIDIDGMSIDIDCRVFIGGGDGLVGNVKSGSVTDSYFLLLGVYDGESLLIYVVMSIRYHTLLWKQLVVKRVN